MKRLLLLVVAIVSAVSAAFVVVEVAARSMAPRVAMVYRVRLDDLVTASAPGGISSQYVITNLGDSSAVTLHDFYDDLDEFTWVQTSSHLEAGAASQHDLADLDLPTGYSGYVIVMADQPITGAVLNASPEDTEDSLRTVSLPFVVRQPPPPPPTPTPPPPPPPPPPLGDGFYLVGTEIKPGKWHSTGTGSTCYWARYDAYQKILDNHFGLAGGTVNVRASDYEVQFNRCGTWEYVEDQPRALQPGAADPKEDGFYTVGVEILPGRWRSTGTGTTCYWARLDSYQRILSNHFGLAGGTVTIRESDYEVMFSQCGTFVYLGPP